MPANTPNLGLPYPVPADTVDVPRDVKALADTLDATSALRPPVVAALPGSPVDGQEVYYQNATMATAGIVWRLRYRAASPSAFKWEFLGGGSLMGEVATAELGPSGVYGDLATVGPSIALPLAGDYELDFGYQVSAGSGSYAAMSYAVGAAAATDADAAEIILLAGAMHTGQRAVRRTGLAVVTLTAKYRVGAANVPTFSKRWMRARPVRVG